jgi:hypothetical protein
MDDEELAEIMSGPGYCKDCKHHVDQLAMVQFRGSGPDPEHDHIPGLIGYCIKCALARFATKVH